MGDSSPYDGRFSCMGKPAVNLTFSGFPGWNQQTITFLQKKADRNAKMLALADKLSNLRAIARDVDSVGDRIWERFHQNDKKMHGWLYRQTAEALRELASYPAWKEYDRLIKKVFEQE